MLFIGKPKGRSRMLSNRTFILYTFVVISVESSAKHRVLVTTSPCDRPPPLKSSHLSIAFTTTPPNMGERGQPCLRPRCSTSFLFMPNLRRSKKRAGKEIVLKKFSKSRKVIQIVPWFRATSCNALIKREICRRLDLSGRKPSCKPSKTDCCSRLSESRLPQTLVTILAAVFMKQIGRIDSDIFSSPTFFGMSVISVPSHDVGIFPFCITWFTTCEVKIAFIIARKERM